MWLPRSNRLFLCSAGRLCCRALPPRAPARARERRPAERALERADRAADQVGAPPPGAAPALGTAERERRGNSREADAAMDAEQERRGVEQSKGVDDGGSASSRARSVSVRTRVSSCALSASSSCFVAGTTEWDNRDNGTTGGTTGQPRGQPGTIALRPRRRGTRQAAAAVSRRAPAVSDGAAGTRAAEHKLQQRPGRRGEIGGERRRRWRRAATERLAEPDRRLRLVCLSVDQRSELKTE
jgi:hypothetical protein